MFIQYYDSPLGKMLLAADEIGLLAFGMKIKNIMRMV